MVDKVVNSNVPSYAAVRETSTHKVPTQVKGFKNSSNLKTVNKTNDKWYK